MAHQYLHIYVYDGAQIGMYESKEETLFTLRMMQRVSPLHEDECFVFLLPLGGVL